MKNLVITFFLALAFSTAFSQTKLTPAPKLTVSFGGIKSGNASTESIKKIVDSAITVKDEKGNTYPLTHFRINYMFKSSYKDEETEQTKTSNELRVFEFYDTAVLSDNWKESIRDNVKLGDELLINNISVRLKNGKKMLAPEYRLKVTQ